ncbi:unnamed protein product [Meloidogyne enterolobii]|uniref:Uncharacterized protein n=1 Tax=Meloidogyne enterolobii TaxID=390850 RepID=A0ACB0Y0B3_MELEN
MFRVIRCVLFSFFIRSALKYVTELDELDVLSTSSFITCSFSSDSSLMTLRVVTGL